jgi:hypothetical protein
MIFSAIQTIPLYSCPTECSTVTKYGFHTVEFLAFVLPAVPNQLPVRIGILTFYFLLHLCRLHIVYSHYKKKWLNKEY